jgi:hypothetical protein
MDTVPRRLSLQRIQPRHWDNVGPLAQTHRAIDLVRLLPCPFGWPNRYLSTTFPLNIHPHSKFKTRYGQPFDPFVFLALKMRKPKALPGDLDHMSIKLLTTIRSITGRRVYDKNITFQIMSMESTFPGSVPSVWLLTAIGACHTLASTGSVCMGAKDENKTKKFSNMIDKKITCANSMISYHASLSIVS